LCEVVTRNVNQVRNVIIYSRSIPKNLKDIVIRELINLFSIAVAHKDVVTQTLSVRISSVRIVKMTGKLLHTFRMILLIIPFDRGHEYVDPLTHVPKDFLFKKSQVTLLAHLRH